SSTIIRYRLFSPARVELTMFNTLGEKLAILFNGRQPAGEYTINVKLSNTSSGVYYYRLSADKYQQTKKMIFLR
ncbi:MAG TPA: T9SS type A sorting domain-containing protein, partial [Calditrichaeota bacterium]|nr:T9SS type A sorting domain-containing protein [Calditrichota bacterium]